MSNIDLSVVIPTYNEQEVIGKVVEDWDNILKELSIEYEINVYNDGSKDNTFEVLKSINEKYPRLRIHDKPNSGHGSTILLGYRESDHANWIFQVDSDNEISASSFKEFWKIKEEFDFIVGKRNHSNRPKVRTIISFVSLAIVKLLYRGKTNDVNVPYRLMRTLEFRNIFEQIPDDTFAPNVIISGCASVKKLRIKQIPVTSSMRATGEVSIKKWKLFKVAVKSLLQTISFRFRLK